MASKIKEKIEGRNEELKSSSYELFILVLSILSIVNLVLDWIVSDPNIENVILVMDILLSIIFMSDFLMRLLTAESKRHYFINQLGWLDLISSLPFPRAKIARTARIFRAIKLMRNFGLVNMIREFVTNRAGSAVYTLGLFVILMLEFGSIAILLAERSAADANIQTGTDALWWSFVTISTVGYGDFYPTTDQGRFVAIFVIVIGVGLFGVVTGFLANAFLPDEDTQPDKAAADLGMIMTELKKLQEAQKQSDDALNERLTALEGSLKTSKSEN